ncbi:MAG: GTPase ObgE [Microgenomates group bacterium ADurb.Bin219]|nr:MAG: GTPase ObgE [Microgenomates group bacterium ADurb.Bin219]HNP89501.1 50S ribosome-binding GTPase [Candidatus Woesebacteria bacterium]
MQTIEERIKEIEEVLAKTPHHKATNKFIGLMRAKIAKLKNEQWLKSSGGGGGGGGFAVAKTGDASVALVGFPSVGKSTLINKLTNAESKVGAYDFTTLDVVPGMMDYKGAKIQIFDIPGIISGAAAGKGRGKEVISVARNADLIVIVVDPKYKDRVEEIKKELFEAGIRLDCLPPKVSITKTSFGGVNFSSNIPLPFDEDTIKELAREFRLVNADITIKEKISLDQLIDAFMTNRVYLPSLAVLNKADLLPQKPKNINFDLLISADKNTGLDQLKELIWQKLNFGRIYLKRPGMAADMENPFIIKLGESLSQILSKISICDKDTFTKAHVFGPGAKFPNQEVSLSFVPQEGTVVEFS